MQSGADVDIITGRPKAEKGSPQDRLYDQSKWFSVDESEAAKKLTAMIESMLIDHIKVLIANDPRADALMSILTEMGYRRSIAERAVQSLANPRASRGNWST